jgi:hypothetical protein
VEVTCSCNFDEQQSRECWRKDGDVTDLRGSKGRIREWTEAEASLSQLWHVVHVNDAFARRHGAVNERSMNVIVTSRRLCPVIDVHHSHMRAAKVLPTYGSR